jgi:hypothetical protein
MEPRCDRATRRCLVPGSPRPLDQTTGWAAPGRASRSRPVTGTALALFRSKCMRLRGGTTGGTTGVGAQNLYTLRIYPRSSPSLCESSVAFFHSKEPLPSSAP